MLGHCRNQNAHDERALSHKACRGLKPRQRAETGDQERRDDVKSFDVPAVASTSLTLA
jgi:hypothetical protein